MSLEAEARETRCHRLPRKLFWVEVRQKYSIANGILSCLLRVWKSGATLRSTF